MSSSSAAFFAENFAGTVSVFVGAPGTAKTPLTNTASAGGLAFGGGCFWVAGAARPSSAFCLASSESYCCSTGLMLITTNSMTSRRSFAAAKRAMGSSRCVSLGQEPAISCAMGTDLCRSASKPARCCSCAAGVIACIVRSAVPAAGSAHAGARRSMIVCPCPSLAPAAIPADSNSPRRRRCRSSSVSEL